MSIEKIVLDTNGLLQMLNRKSPYHHILQKIVKGEISLCISNEIIMEYSEVITNHTNKSVADTVIAFILNNPATIRVDDYVRWNIVTTDPDDNKFVDCAIWANARFLVSDDKHLRILKKKVPPLVDLKTLQEYHEYLTAKQLSGIRGRKRKK